MARSQQPSTSFGLPEGRTDVPVGFPLHVRFAPSPEEFFQLVSGEGGEGLVYGMEYWNEFAGEVDWNGDPPPRC